MLMDEYFGAMKGVLEKVEQTQREAVLEASAEIAERTVPRRRVAYYGHRPYAEV